MYKYLTIFLILCSLLVIKFNFDLTGAEEWQIVFFDVGQGDSILITNSQSIQVLIDGGPDDKVLEKLGKFMPVWDKQIELMVLTHPDKDHLTGLNSVFKNYEVSRVVMTNIEKDSAGYSEFLSLVEDEDSEVVLPVNKTFWLDNEVYLEALYPFADLSGQPTTDYNNSSIVLKLVTPEKSVLLTGDLEKSGETELIGSKVYMKSSVLKLGHHGSKSSTSENFVRAVDPSLAIVSAGIDNRYGHPHQEVIDRLTNIEVWQTSEQGDIVYSLR